MGLITARVFNFDLRHVMIMTGKGQHREFMGVLFQVAIGGALGAVARLVVTRVAAQVLGAGFPWGTLLVNVVGSFAMGLLTVVLMARGLAAWSPLLLTGVLGGFTTFSAFSLETVTLWQEGTPGLAITNVAAGTGLAVLALVAGMALGRGLS